MNDAEDYKSENLTLVIEDLQNRCQILLAELSAFKNYIKTHHSERAIKLSHLERNIKADVKSLNKLSRKNEDDEIRDTGERISHALRSSNVPFYETVWATAKRSSGVKAFGKRFYPPSAKESTKSKSRNEGALVDIVADNGLEWTKVSTITQTRLVFDLARQGWERGDATSGSEEDRESGRFDEDEVDDEDDGVPIFRIAEHLSRISKATRVRYRHPRVRLVLPKISEGQIDEIDTLLSDIRKLGVIVETADCVARHLTPRLDDNVSSKMAVQEFSTFSSVLNIDCTILLALVSDLSHFTVKEEKWFHQATKHQIESEEKSSLLPSSLYPALGNHEMVCTEEAAQRFQEIVDTIGSPTEKARAVAVMGSNGKTEAKDLLFALQEQSQYPVPDNLRLPIRIISATAGNISSSNGNGDSDGINNDSVYHHDTLEHNGEQQNSERSGLPEIAERIGRDLSSINRSVFLYGWRTGCTTITSNRMVAKQIESMIDEYHADSHIGVNDGSSGSSGQGDGQEDKAIGPDIWLCPTARSLIGKEKSRRS